MLIQIASISLGTVQQASVNQTILAGLNRINAGFAKFVASQFDTSYTCSDVEEVVDDDSPPREIKEYNLPGNFCNDDREVW